MGDCVTVHLGLNFVQSSELKNVMFSMEWKSKNAVDYQNISPILETGLHLVPIWISSYGCGQSKAETATQKMDSLAWCTAVSMCVKWGRPVVRMRQFFDKVKRIA